MWEVVHQLLRKPPDAEHAAALLKNLAVDPSFGSAEEAIDAYVRGAGPPLPVTAIMTAMLGGGKKRTNKRPAMPPDKDSTGRLGLRTLFVKRRRRLMGVILSGIALATFLASGWIRLNAERLRPQVVIVRMDEPQVAHGILRVSVKPWGRVSIDGVYKGDTRAFGGIELPLGPHQVVAVHPKLGRREVTVTLDRVGEEQSVSIDLLKR
jgi:hypothetical protein